MKKILNRLKLITSTLVINTLILLISSNSIQAYSSDEHEVSERIERESSHQDISDRQQEDHVYVANELIVRLNTGVTRSLVNELGSSHSVSIVQEIPQINSYLLQVPQGVDIDDVSRTFESHPGVKYVEPNYQGRGGEVLPTDYYFSKQWHLNNLGQSGGTVDADIDAVEGWELTRGNKSIIVAVLDTGIFADHPEFVGRVLPGWDFVNNDADPTADHSHGVYVAGILAASADNAFGVAGIDHQAMLLPVKVLNEENIGTTFNLAQGLVFASDQGAHIINLSLINYPLRGSLLPDALSYARDTGSVLISCAGNGGLGDADRSYPGASPLTVSVGTTDHNDIRAYFSATGDALDVVAPGVDAVTVHSSVIYNLYSQVTGCSAATPVVSGITSLLLSLDEHLTHDQVHQILILSAEDQVGQKDEDTVGRDDFYGFGRVNLANALILSTTVLTVAIDIAPDNDRNNIKPSSHEDVEVAILGNSVFKVSRVNCHTLGLGPAQAPALECEFEDIDNDGFIDMLAEFQINKTGISCGDTEATLIGRTFEGYDIIGTDIVTTIIGCRSDD